MTQKAAFALLISLFIVLSGSQIVNAQEALSPGDLLSLKSLGLVQVSSSGEEAIYYVSTPRGANEAPGGSTTQYFRTSLHKHMGIPLFDKGMKCSSPQFSPDGQHIGFLHASEGEPQQVWIMDSDGANMMKLTVESSGVSRFKWQPGKQGIAYTSRELTSEREKELKKRGYDFIYYEENLKNYMLHLASYDEEWKQISERQLTFEGNTWDFEFNHQGSHIAASISPKNLIDHRYAFRKIYLIDLKTGQMKQVSENEGKLGNYAFSPGGDKLAYTAALNINDHQISQALVVDLSSKKVSNLTPEDFRGHIGWVNWKDDNYLIYHAGEGAYPTLSVVPVAGGPRKVILNGADQGVIFGHPYFSPDFKNFIFNGSTPTDKNNLYSWDGKNDLEQVSFQNPLLIERALGKQEVIRYMARDGQEIEGIIIHPVEYKKGQSYPLVLYIHGGPESHESNGWLSRYSNPGQVMAGKGYLVLYLNYRSSTGYGVDFAMEGFMDPAGKEFDDIADAIEWAVKEKGADPDRVGIAGGSYGGYASAWFATYYTQYVRAACMFVGISNVASKRGTTDIPYEELYVHSGKKLEEQWQMNLERSPVYWAHQSKTATLIYGGASDTRVHPSQSLELYRRMKMNDHPAVRLVQYPDEGHGNRKQVGQIDVLYRQMEWLDWYVKDAHPLDGPMPRLDISDRYGLDWDF
jgi:dipeptidyl aminopeptidase/acylaminoacyl peptidase